jgi:hypothetical protein
VRRRKINILERILDAGVSRTEGVFARVDKKMRVEEKRGWSRSQKAEEVEGHVGLAEGMI